VADQPVPNYLIHDTEKWGDCLSGALPMWEYLAGLVQAGFLGVHQMKFTPWSAIDGIHFLSLTLTGYKLPETAEPAGFRFATLAGPFSRAVDELQQAYYRGVPEPISARTAQLLTTPPFERPFLLSAQPSPLSTRLSPRMGMRRSGRCASTPCKSTSASCATRPARTAMWMRDLPGPRS